MHMLVKTLCTCSCGMVLMMHVRMTPLPIWWVSDCEGSHRQRWICVASRILTTKIPSALLMAITWLQRTWCPRFRRGTFGYGITTSPTREVEYEYRVFMRMHVSMSKVPKCICYSMHAQNDIYFNSQSCEQNQREQVQNGGIDLIFDWHKIFGRVWDSPQNFDLITNSITNDLRRSPLKECLVQALHRRGFLELPTTFGITMQTSCTTRFLVQPTAIVNQTRLFHTRVPFKYYTHTT
jgi:hypothetical protein